MTYDYYISLVGEAKNLPTEEQFVGEIGYPAEEPLESDDFLKVLHIIYAVSREDFQELVKTSGLKMTVFGRKFNIPYRSMQNWAADKCKAPEYILQMLGYVLITEVYLCQKDET